MRLWWFWLLFIGLLGCAWKVIEVGFAHDWDEFMQWVILSMVVLTWMGDAARESAAEGQKQAVKDETERQRRARGLRGGPF